MALFKNRALPVLIALAAIWAFFADFLPPRFTAHFTYDFEGFHYPLLNYAFKALRTGRFPEWDPTNYGGVPFCANIQAGLFYPPNWVVFFVNRHRGGMSFHTIQILAVFHYWMGAMFAWHWLRRLPLAPVAAALGALTFALCGFPLADAQHLGVVCGYMWIPLALAGVEDVRGGAMWKFWKIAIAGAMCVLAGYPVMWFALSLAVLIYALPEWRVTSIAFGALLFSLALAAVQLLPTQEAAALREAEFVYGNSVDPRMLWQFIRPEYWKTITAPWFTFLYLGSGFIAGAVWLVLKRAWPWRPLAMIAAALFLAFDPYRIVSTVLQSVMPNLLQVLQQWHFLAVIPAGAALIAARGVDRFTQNRALWRTAVAVALCAFTFWEFRQYGIHQSFNTKAGSVDQRYYADARRGGPEFYGLNPATFRLLEAPQFRTAAPLGVPHSNDFRHYLINTLQGFDPLLPASYKREVERFGKFESNRLFSPDPDNEAMLRNFGVRWVITIDGELQNRLRKDARYVPIGPDGYFFKVFELKDAQPVYRWNGETRIKTWTPEMHDLDVTSPAGGRFVLLEQRFPGWTATVDGKPTPIVPHSEAFQAVDVPPGGHNVRFQFRSQRMRTGAAITGASMAVLLAAIWMLCRRSAQASSSSMAS